MQKRPGSSSTPNMSTSPKQASSLIEKAQATRAEHWLDVVASDAHVVGGDDGVHLSRSGKAMHVTHTDTTAVTYGPEMQVKRYERPIDMFKVIHRKNPVPSPIKIKRSDNLRRASTNARRLVIANYPTRKKKYVMPVWTTWTYADPDRGADREQVILDAQDFFRSLRRTYGRQIEYIYALEIQPKRRIKHGVDVWHIHALIFNMPYNDMDEFKAHWKHGHPDAQWVERLKPGYKNGVENADKIACYITKLVNKIKYMTKENPDLPFNKKMYTISHGLLKPETWSQARAVRRLLQFKIDEGYKKKYLGDKSYYSPHFDMWYTVEIWAPA